MSLWAAFLIVYLLCYFMWEQSDWLLPVAPEYCSTGRCQCLSTRTYPWPSMSCLSLRLLTASDNAATVYEASKLSDMVGLRVRDVHLSAGPVLGRFPLSGQALQESDSCKENTVPSTPGRNFWFWVFRHIWKSVSKSAYLCSITLLLGTSFQNWVNSAGPVPDDCSISAAMIRNRSWAETLKPAFHKSSATYEHQLSWG